MTIFDALALIGGLCLFLFGMNLMGEALERRAGNSLRTILGKFTTGRLAGFLTGLGVTAIIQSSSATTVMVVGFVNSGLMTLKQAINVIMGANVGTTVTAWILSLSGIESSNVIVKLFKPTSFTPVLALIGIILYMFSSSKKKKDTGVILLGFATLMFGMDAMSSAVAGLKEAPWFADLFLMFTNPILGVLAGAILTAIIQSSSASVGILQALTVTGSVSFGAAIPIIMGQNIGTCITALLSSIGTTKNAKRASLVHLSFNVIGTVVWLAVFSIVRYVFTPAILTESIESFEIAILHSIFNIACTIILLPMAGLLEKLANKLIPDSKEKETAVELDERLLATPAVALDRCRQVTSEMAVYAIDTLRDSITAIKEYTPELAEQIRNGENKTDHYEDILGSYLVKLSTNQITNEESAEATMLLKIIGDFERISDHGVNILESVEELRAKDLTFTPDAQAELKVLTDAIDEITTLAFKAFNENDMDAVNAVEPLEQVIDRLKEKLRTNHIIRLQQGESTIDVGFVWSDLITNLERISDHCSNIAGCIFDIRMNDMNIHENLRALREDNEEYKNKYDFYKSKYAFNN